MGAIMMGSGYSGIFVNIIRAICLLAMPTGFDFLGALIYFLIAAIVMIFAALVHIKFQNLPYIQKMIILSKKPPELETITSPIA
jgi:hypothetical protein